MLVRFEEAARLMVGANQNRHGAAAMLRIANGITYRA